MCGIAGFYIKNPGSGLGLESQDRLDLLTDMLLLGIEPRGHDSSGVVSVRRGAKTAELCKADLTAAKFIGWREPIAASTRMVMCHTRFATKGSPTNLLNDHPVEYKGAFAVHNGHINNDDELFKEHELERMAEVDTEIIPALFWKFGIDKAHQALQVLDGGFAIGVCQPDEYPDTLLLAKGYNSPFEYIDTPDIFMWASTKKALEDTWKDMWGSIPRRKFWGDLRPGDIKIITTGGVEDLRFKMYLKPYVQPVHTSKPWHRTPTVITGQTTQAELNQISHSGHSESAEEWAELNKRKWNKLCECGDTQWWHEGKNYDGQNIRATSDCLSFKEKLIVIDETELEVEIEEILASHPQLPGISGAGRVIYVKCEGCDNYVPKNECVDICGYEICSLCNEEDDEEEDDDKSSITAGSRLPDEEESYTDDIIEVARKLDLKPKFVYWLLVLATNEDFEDNVWLVEPYSIADDLHQQVLIEQGKKAAEAAPLQCGVQVFNLDGAEEEVLH